MAGKGLAAPACSSSMGRQKHFFNPWHIQQGVSHMGAWSAAWIDSGLGWDNGQERDGHLCSLGRWPEEEGDEREEGPPWRGRRGRGGCGTGNPGSDGGCRGCGAGARQSGGQSRPGWRRRGRAAEQARGVGCRIGGGAWRRRRLGGAGGRLWGCLRGHVVHRPRERSSHHPRSWILAELLLDLHELVLFEPKRGTAFGWGAARAPVLALFSLSKGLQRSPRRAGAGGR